MMMNKCPVCNQEILYTERPFMIGLEKPYMNIFFHKECYNQVEGNMTEFLDENIDNILALVKDMKKKNK